MATAETPTYTKQGDDVLVSVLVKAAPADAEKGVAAEVLDGSKLEEITSCAVQELRKVLLKEAERRNADAEIARYQVVKNESRPTIR